MGSGRRVLVLALTLVAVGVTAPSTPAYHFRALKWPGGVVPYYNAAPDQAWAVSQAVGAWNRSGAHVRFVATSQSAAKLVIEEEPDKVYCAEGHATVGYAPRGARVVIFPASGITHACNRYWAVRVMTHELGHVLGLLHEDRVCSVMNARGNLHGGDECLPRLLWEWRCRLLEPDDVAGAVAAYGGRARPPSEPERCPLYKAIPSPAGFAASYDSTSGYATVTFRRPAGPVIPAFVVPSPWSPRTSFSLARLGPTCATHEDPATAPHYRWDVKPGALETLHVPVASGVSCLAVWAADELGRPSAKPATVKLTVP